MAHWIIGIDASNGMQNYSALKQKSDGSFQRRKDISLQSVRAAVDSGTFGMGSIGETQFDYYQWYDFMYTVGETALEHARGGVMPISGRHRYGEEHQLFSIAVGLYELGLKDGDTCDICLLAPPGDSNRAGEMYRDGLKKFDHKLEISKSGGKARTFEVTSVTVFLETVAAGFACHHDDDGTFQHKNPLTNAVMLVDGGRVTLDRLIFRNGKIDKTTIPDATNEQLGVGPHILEPVAKWIRTNLPPVYHDGAEELADRALRSPKANSDGETQYFIHRLGEPPRNVTRPVVQGVANYHSAVNDYLSKELRRSPLQRVLLVGGIEPLIGDRLRDGFGHAVDFVSLKDYDHLKKVDPTYLNSVGALRYLVKKCSQ